MARPERELPEKVGEGVPWMVPVVSPVEGVAARGLIPMRAGLTKRRQANGHGAAAAKFAGPCPARLPPWSRKRNPRIGSSLDLGSVLHEVVGSARALTGAIATIEEAGGPEDFVTCGITGEKDRAMDAWPDGPKHFEDLRDPVPARRGQRKPGARLCQAAPRQAWRRRGGSRTDPYRAWRRLPHGAARRKARAMGRDALGAVQSGDAGPAAAWDVTDAAVVRRCATGSGTGRIAK